LLLSVNNQNIFQKEKIKNSLLKASKNVGVKDLELIDKITKDIINYISQTYPSNKNQLILWILDQL